jgi:hypothetical protein
MANDRQIITRMGNLLRRACAGDIASGMQTKHRTDVEANSPPLGVETGTSFVLIFTAARSECAANRRRRSRQLATAKSIGYTAPRREPEDMQ